jgi:hypothetical protein
MPEPKHIIPKKVKSALNILFTDPKADLAIAAAAVGMPTYTLRRMLKLPHIRKYAYHERRALLDALCMATPASLKDVINNSENSMARVAAVRQVEALRAADHAESVITADYGPGLQIVVIERGQIERTIGPPVIEHEPVEGMLPELEPQGR